MNRKQFLDDTIAMLAAQGKQSMRGEGCAYRGKDGAKCAIGFHIPDKLYRPDMDVQEGPFGPGSMTVTALFDKYPEVCEAIEAKYGPLELTIVGRHGDDLDFLQRVQTHLHDHIEEESYFTVEHLTDIAKTERLYPK